MNIKDKRHKHDIKKYVEGNLFRIGFNIYLIYIHILYI